MRTAPATWCGVRSTSTASSRARGSAGRGGPRLEALLQAQQGRKVDPAVAPEPLHVGQQRCARAQHGVPRVGDRPGRGDAAAEDRHVGEDRRAGLTEQGRRGGGVVTGGEQPLAHRGAVLGRGVAQRHHLVAHRGEVPHRQCAADPGPDGDQHHDGQHHEDGVDHGGAAAGEPTEQGRPGRAGPVVLAQGLGGGVVGAQASSPGCSATMRS